MEFLGETRIRFASVEEGRAALARRDAFLQSLSPFDRQSRMQTDRDVSGEEFLAFVQKQVLPWPAADVERLSAVFARLAGKLAPMRLRLPPTILLVLTTGEGEGDAAYCRGAAIVLPRAIVERANGLDRFAAHELFHVVCTHNPKLRERLYALVGFRPCHEIELPAWLAKRKITNPDAPRLDHLAEINHGGERICVVPILLSSTDRYDVGRGGVLFDYLQVRLMVVRRHGDRWLPDERQGAPRLLDPQAVPAYLDALGRNTDYILHPEEALAENFVLLVNGALHVPAPRLLGEMKRVLTQESLSPPR